VGRKPPSILARGGKRVYVSKTIRGSRKEARRWLNETLRNRDLGVRLDRSYLTLNEYLDRWLADAVASKVRANTSASYRDCLRHVRALLGGVPLDKLRPLDVEHALARIRGQGLAPRTAQNTLEVACPFFSTSRN
jgi:hypothetical protein